MATHPSRLSLSAVDRRQFLKTAAVAAGALTASSIPSHLLFAGEQATSTPTSEAFVKDLYETFSPAQKKAICFDWNHVSPGRGLLRTHVNNNWNITSQDINSSFYQPEQRDLIRKIFEGMVNPEWVSKFDTQLNDDAGGFGTDQTIAIFGVPGSDQFEFVMTGRHMTMRCDGNTTAHVAFGGPIFYGHASETFNESKDHVGNVFWVQALAANGVYKLLDGKQQKAAMVRRTPGEGDAAFRKDIAGLPLSEMSNDQREAMEGVLSKLLEPYRMTDQEEVRTALKKMGGLEACRLAFYADSDLGNDKVWDNWRLEGPSFVWHFRGNPHVHCWVHVADDASVKLNTPHTLQRG